MTRIDLSAIMDRGAVEKHLAELKAAMSSTGPVEIGCEAVEQIGLAGLQLLASALRTGEKHGIDVVLTAAADALTKTAGLAGMTSILFPQSGASA